MAEAEFERGAYLVIVEQGSHSVRHITDYYRREFIRWRFDVSKFNSPEELSTAVLNNVDERRQAWVNPPVVELTLHGQLGFKRQELDVKTLESQIQARLGALVLLFKFEAIPRAGHLPCIEQPVRLAGLVSDFLAGHRLI